MAGCPMTSRRRRTDARQGTAGSGWPIGCSAGNEAWRSPWMEAGAELDGFRIGERVHQGGMATLWTVTHPGIPGPLLMKVPRMSEGEDPAAIVSFEMEQMILPRLAGPHVPAASEPAISTGQPYVVMERVPGGASMSRLERLPLPMKRRG